MTNEQRDTLNWRIKNDWSTVDSDSSGKHRDAELDNPVSAMVAVVNK